ncbi:tRNA pseudouridine(13) synthase TruD [Planctomicrobium sp. SH668]|uniref:tRNA pseudouridine(13) synthase TruD n=1 Tax=Planctomicrobium sp. SH668 TaxID=3448126 RepID=UPI003F5B0319
MEDALPDAGDQFEVSTTPYLTPLELAIGGQLKFEPEDFVVEEIPAYEPCGHGDHLFLWVQKQDSGAEFLVGHIARKLQISRDDIGVAGLKDRRAVTRQWISVPAAAASRVDEINCDEIQVLNSSLHTNKLKTGHLNGNRFEIVVRNVVPGSFEIAQKIQKLIEESGVPNYFGDQRFGTDQQTLELGMSLLKGETTSRQIPFKRRKFLTRLSLSAAQSSLFNSVVRMRLEQQSLHRVLSQDVMQVVQSNGLFLAEDLIAEQARFDARETMITGPIYGPKMKLPAGEVQELEQAVLDSAGLSRDVFRVYKKLTPGARRPLLLRPGNLLLKPHEFGLSLSFSIPSGAYATIVLREFMKA